MSSQSKLAVGFFWFAMVLALCAPPAQAGHSGHRNRRHHQGLKRLVKSQVKSTPSPTATPPSK